MRICLIATNGFTHDPRARATAQQLAAAGHEVVVVASGLAPVEASPFPTEWISTAQPRRLTRFLRPAARSAREIWLDGMTSAAAASGADLFHACSAQAVPVAQAAALRTRATVTRRPDWPKAGNVDLVDLAPGRPEANPTVRTLLLNHHNPADKRPGYQPSPKRHAGRKLALIYRRTGTNPGRYLEAALIRAGVDVRNLHDNLDWAAVAGCDAAVFVESPPPALRIAGQRPSIPVGFWVHHGEHHLAANLRLTQRYGADFVLLAHSWHLTHYFPVPVVRFPFGVPPELVDPGRSWADRELVVAMVGAHLREGGPYPLRHELVNGLERHLGTERVAFEEGVSTSRMAELYAAARLVPNEGGTRHFPITMRVFEAIGSGAVLWTRPTPGLDQLFEPMKHYLPMREDYLTQVDEVLSDPTLHAGIAEAGAQHAYAHHTYDHRVDELFAALDAQVSTNHEPTPLHRVTGDPLVAWIEADVEVQRILDASSRGIARSFPDREVWTLAQVREPPSGSFTAVVVDDSTEVPEVAVAAARKFIYALGAQATTVATEHRRDVEIEEREGVTRVDLLPADGRGTIPS